MRLLLLLAALVVADDPAEVVILERWKKAADVQIASDEGTIKTLSSFLEDLQAKATMAKTGQVLFGAKEEIRIMGGKMSYIFPSLPAKTARVMAIEKDIETNRNRITVEKDKLDALKARGYIVPPMPADTMKIGDAGLLVDAKGVPIKTKVVQVLDGSNMIGRADKLMCWFQVKTAGFVTGREEVLLYAFRVAETKTYKNVVGGTNTVFVLVPVKLPKKE